MLRLRDQTNPNQILSELHSFFDNILQQNAPRILFDMGNVPFPSASFIALLISKTIEARRKGGNLEIINLLDTARNHFSIFTPLTYLSILSDASLIESEAHIKESHRMQVHRAEEMVMDSGARLLIDAAVGELQQATQFVSDQAEAAGIDPIERSKLKIAVYEACMNIIEHGYRYQADRQIDLLAEIDRHRLVIIITDWGRPFNGFGQSEYDVHAAFNEQHRGGFGLYIIDQSVDETHYKVTAEGNRLTLIKDIH